MKRLLRAIEILAWAGFFALALTVLAVRFWLLPDIERYREDIVAAVSRTVGQPVKIGRIEAGWLGINPQVNLYDVHILDAQGRDALVLPAVENSIGWRSLVMGELRLHALAIDGPRLAVRRDAQGDLYVAGMKVGAGAPGGEGGIGDWVLSQPEIVIRNAEVEWIDEKRGAPPLALSGLSFRLRNTLWDHEAGLSARVPPELGHAIELRAELSGRSLADRTAWRGRLYAETGYTALGGWKPWIDYPIALPGGYGAARAWATLERGRVAEMSADLYLADLAPDLAPMQVRVGWKAAARGAAERSSFATRELDLQSLARAAEVFELPPELRERIARVAPRGLLRDVKLEWEGAPSAPAKFAVRARFAGLAVQAADGLPGFAGLSGTVDATETRGALVFDGKNAELDLPRLFPEPRLTFDSLAAQLSWEHRGPGGEENGWSVRLASLSFANADLEGGAAGTYATPGFGPGVADLSAEIRRADGRRITRYLPSPELMGAATRAYLVDVIKAGEGRDAKLRLRGDLADFPFHDPAKGEFQVTARVEKGLVEPGAGWPAIQDIDAQLLFQGDRMEITSRSATVHGAQLSGVKVEIPQLSAPGPHLIASGHGEGTLAQFLAFVEASPVRRMAAGLVDGMEAEGRGKLNLRIDIPLRDTERTAVAGDFSFAASKLSFPQLPPIERATGALAFTESTLAVREGRGRLLGGPLAVSGGTRSGGVELTARGDASVAALQATGALDPALLRNFSGAAPYSATLSLRNGRGRAVIESSLRGLASVLPPPFAKGAAEALPLRIEVAASDSGRDRVSVQLGSLVNAELLRRREGDAMAVQRAGVSLAPQKGVPVRLPEQAGILVYGSLPAFDADRWLQLRSGTGPDLRKSDRSSSAAGSSGPVPDLPVLLDVKTATLDVYGKRIRDIALQGSVDAAGWTAKVQATELAGDLSYRSADGGLLEANLAHFLVPGDTPGVPAARSATAKQRELPAVKLAAQSFRLKDIDLGRVEVAAVPEGADWRIQRLLVTNVDGTLNGKGLWRAGPASLTSLSLDLDAPQPGRLLRRLGYPDLLRGGHVRMQASLSWAGDPIVIDYPSLSGDIQLQAEDGRFVEIDPGIGKLLSVMSLQALPRRLTLDFRDVFSKGFAFERIRSSAHVDKGIMTLRDFDMRGSAADVDMKGKVDLVQETQELSVRVVPQLGDTASTALLFVNPFLFFPAAIAQRILKDPLGHIFAFNYNVTGSWADPKVERTRIDAQEVPEPSRVPE